MIFIPNSWHQFYGSGKSSVERSYELQTSVSPTKFDKDDHKIEQSQVLSTTQNLAKKSQSCIVIFPKRYMPTTNL